MSKRIISLQDLANAHANLKEGEVILDVRNPDEYEQGHIPGSLNIPLGDLEQRHEELRSYQAVYIHCKMGGRAKKAFDLLDSLGLENTHCLQEVGFVAWENEGHPVNR